jgi:hypothetical protein
VERNRHVPPSRSRGFERSVSEDYTRDQDEETQTPTAPSHEPAWRLWWQSVQTVFSPKGFSRPPR